MRTPHHLPRGTATFARSYSVNTPLVIEVPADLLAEALARLDMKRTPAARIAAQQLRERYGNASHSFGRAA